MSDFVVYHNQDARGGPPRRRGAGPFGIYSDKPNLERLLGNRVWVVSGRGTPKKWFLHYWFCPSAVEPRGVRGEMGAAAPAADGVPLDRFEWFNRLYVDRKLFSFGLQSLASTDGLELAKEFADLATGWTQRGPAGSPAAGATSRGPRRRVAVARRRAREAPMQTLTMNIERQYFAAIVAGTKDTEYRKVKPFWTRRIEPLSVPFKLRLQNGMTHPIPEVVVVVKRVSIDEEKQVYRLHLGKLLQLRHWDRRTQRLVS